MKKLYDETHDYGANDRRRTQWYQLAQADGLDFLFAPPEEYGVSFLLPSDYKELILVLRAAVQASRADKENEGVSETHWVFYTDRVDGDAIGDKVRFTILLREKDGHLGCDIIYSDFLLASAFEQLQQLRQAILAGI